jgi:hypothetical protein
MNQPTCPRTMVIMIGPRRYRKQSTKKEVAGYLIPSPNHIRNHQYPEDAPPSPPTGTYVANKRLRMSAAKDANPAVVPHLLALCSNQQQIDVPPCRCTSRQGMRPGFLQGNLPPCLLQATGYRSWQAPRLVPLKMAGDSGDSPDWQRHVLLTFMPFLPTQLATKYEGRKQDSCDLRRP